MGITRCLSFCEIFSSAADVELPLPRLPYATPSMPRRPQEPLERCLSRRFQQISLPINVTCDGFEFGAVADGRVGCFLEKHTLTVSVNHVVERSNHGEI